MSKSGEESSWVKPHESTERHEQCNVMIGDLMQAERHFFAMDGELAMRWTRAICLSKSHFSPAPSLS
jgi:hypothetical protein